MFDRVFESPIEGYILLTAVRNYLDLAKTPLRALRPLPFQRSA